MKEIIHDKGKKIEFIPECLWDTFQLGRISTIKLLPHTLATCNADQKSDPSSYLSLTIGTDHLLAFLSCLADRKD